jgi:hypothetical protein
MTDEIYLELWQESAAPADEAGQIEAGSEIWRQSEIWQTNEADAKDFPDQEIERLLALYSESAESETTGEIDAELLQEVADLGGVLNLWC